MEVGVAVAVAVCAYTVVAQYAKLITIARTIEQARASPCPLPRRIRLPLLKSWVASSLFAQL